MNLDDKKKNSQVEIRTAKNHFDRHLKGRIHFFVMMEKISLKAPIQLSPVGGATPHPHLQKTAAQPFSVHRG